MQRKDNQPEETALGSSAKPVLRRRAEDAAREKAALLPEILESIAPEELQPLFHELRVNQIELEMQNEELRRTQVEREDARARYVDLYDFAPVGYLTLAETGLIQKANLTAATLLGLTREELIKKPITGFILPEDQDIYYLHRKQLSETGKSQTCELRMQGANAAPFWSRLEAVIVQDTDSALEHRVVLSNITERKRTEEELRLDAALFGALAEGIFLIGFDDLAIKWANPMLERMFGYDPGVLIGKPVDILNAPNDKTPAETRNAILHIMKKAGEWHGEVENIRKDGGRFWCYANVSLFDHPQFGKVLVSVHTDITALKQAEKRIQWFSQEILAAREEEKKRVSSILHNEVGSLAVGLSAYMDAIEAELRSGKPKKALQRVELTRKLLNEKVTLLKEMAVQLRPPELDVLGLGAALRQYFSQITRHRLFRICYRETLGPRRVSANTATILFRVAQEALTNALKHGQAKQVEVGLKATKGEVSLTVRDNGKGFDPSEQRSPTISHMGLRVMQEMVASIGGVFAIDTKLGAGTAVRVRLPFTAEGLASGDVTVREETGILEKTARSRGQGPQLNKKKRGA
jgi:PAS domain S-box-containing protein